MAKLSRPAGDAMAADNEEPQDHDEDGIEWRTLNRTVRVDAKTSQKLIDWIGPHLRLIVAAVAWGVFVIATCYAASLVL